MTAIEASCKLQAIESAAQLRQQRAVAAIKQCHIHNVATLAATAAVAPFNTATPTTTPCGTNC